MKSKKCAFTMAELTVCIVMMMILAIFAVTNIKPNDNKIRLFVYTTMNNIESVVSTIVSDHIDLAEADTPVTTGGKTYDWLCLQLADYYSLKKAANCLTTASEADVNLTFPNGVTVQGLASAWKQDTKTQEDGTKYKFKEFVFDIDGNTKGMNKVGIDRFPMRIYRGDMLEGTLVPVNCALANAGNYCKNGGTKTTVDLTKANEYINYDIYKPEAATDSKANIVASYQSYMQADCAIFGGLGYFTPAECSSAGYKVLLTCVNEDICLKCNTGGKNICPLNGSTQLTKDTCVNYSKANNPDNIACLMLQHKPSMGAGMILDTVADTIAE